VTLDVSEWPADGVEELMIVDDVFREWEAAENERRLKDLKGK
jgi:hypothetical protein